MHESQLKEIFKNIRKESQLLKLFENNKELKSHCDFILSCNFFKKYIDYVFFINHNLTYKSCLNCKKPLTFKQLKRGSKYCSNWCLTHSQHVKEKIKNTNLKKYGSIAPIGNYDVKTKKQKTCLERYGSKETLSSPIIRNKIKETNLEKYGFENPGQDESTKIKIQKTCLERYGSEKYVNSKDFKTKIQKTCLEKYGTLSPFENNDIQDKVKNKIKEKYGVDNAFQLDISKEHQRSRKFNQSWNTIKGFKKYVIPLFDKNEWAGYKKKYKWKCVKCGNEWYQPMYKTSFFPKVSNYLPRCLKCYPFIRGISKAEKDLANFCKQYFPNLKENDRKLIKPFELDIVIDEIKLAIEFNGSFYHSINFIENGYHLNKVIKCNENGYRLIHIWEDEWDLNKDLIKQKLIDIFTGKEIIDYSQKLDRSWYNNLSNDFEELPPEIIERNDFEVENCGYLVYFKNKK